MRAKERGKHKNWEDEIFFHCVCFFSVERFQLTDNLHVAARDICVEMGRIGRNCEKSNKKKIFWEILLKSNLFRISSELIKFHSVDWVSKITSDVPDVRWIFRESQIWWIIEFDLEI